MVRTFKVPKCSVSTVCLLCAWVQNALQQASEGIDGDQGGSYHRVYRCGTAAAFARKGQLSGRLTRLGDLWEHFLVHANLRACWRHRVRPAVQRCTLQAFSFGRAEPYIAAAPLRHAGSKGDVASPDRRMVGGSRRGLRNDYTWSLVEM